MARAAREAIGVEPAADGSSHEPAPVAETRERLSRGLGYIEDIVYIGLAVLLAAAALVLLGTSAVAFWRYVAAGTLTGSIVTLLDQLLLVLMVVEILYTVQVSFREHLLTAPPFLLVALIAVVRRIVVLTAESHKVLEKGTAAFHAAMTELGLLTGLSVGLVVCLYLLRPRGATAPPVAEKHHGEPALSRKP
jgi:uncharacterized membrane protein (DUF373 family)